MCESPNRWPLPLRLWVFDEATANTDPAADLMCTDVVSSLPGTVIVICHKLSVRRVVVLRTCASGVD